MLIVIPTYKPTTKLNQIVEEIINSHYFKNIKKNKKILIIDDGNKNLINIEILKNLPNNKYISIISNSKNKGQGYSIKKAITYAIKNEFEYILTADDDGQHTIQDINKFIKESQIKNSEFILGVRLFDKKIPFRSKIGNTVIRIIIQILFGYKISDVTSGLRVYRSSTFSTLLNIKNNRFDFQLLSIIELGNRCVSIPIETIYFENNKNSRYLPFSDSMNIIFSIIIYFFKNLFK
tara:strand:- start:60 stop:764 length:705 start_codon:yes stop_codon:yes gene_type:complete